VSAARELPAHSELGGSVIALVELCPGSYSLSKGMPNTAGRHAREGSLAHALAELCLTKGTDPELYLGQSLPGFEGLEINAEMVEHVGRYVDYCLSETQDGDIVLIEAKFDLSELGEDAEEMFGSSDYVRLRPSTGHLLVVDLKYGAGVPVEILTKDKKPSRQLLYYAVGAALKVRDEGHIVRNGTLVIYQPRAPHSDGVCRIVDVSAIDLLDWIGELLAIARAAYDPNAPLIAGHHCREKFCKALPRCPEHAKWITRQAQLEFSPVGLEVKESDPRLLSPETLSAVLDAAPAVTAWINQCQQYAHQGLERGEGFPGWKLVNKRASRVWDKPQAALVAKLVELGAAREALFSTPSLLSPAQVEKLLPADQRKELATLTKSVSSGTTLAKDDDKRPAIKAGPAADFDPV